MAKSTGKATHRLPKPRGLSPVIAGRVPASLHRQIKEAAKKSGRSMSEEMAWHIGLSFQWQKQFGDIRKLLDDAQRAMSGDLRQAMIRAGYTPIYTSSGTQWAEPQSALSEAVKRLLAETKGENR